MQLYIGLYQVKHVT